MLGAAAERTPEPPRCAACAPAAPAERRAPAGGELKCDKCDGRHRTEACPHFRKTRENHPDAHRMRGKGGGGRHGMAGDGGGKIVRTGRVVRQPGDGNCLFHSMSYGLRDGSTARSLRAEIMSFIRANPTLEISDTPLKDWVKWDTGSSVTSYTAKMAMGGWGGGIEMAAAARLKRVNVEVYETCAAGFKRISVFDAPSARGNVRRRPRALHSPAQKPLPLARRYASSIGEASIMMRWSCDPRGPGTLPALDPTRAARESAPGGLAISRAWVVSIPHTAIA